MTHRQGAVGKFQQQSAFFWSGEDVSFKIMLYCGAKVEPLRISINH